MAKILMRLAGRIFFARSMLTTGDALTKPPIGECSQDTWCISQHALFDESQWVAALSLKTRETMKSEKKN